MIHSDMACPACGARALRIHARYCKYHRDNRIGIVRVLCITCGVTHALIPSFSLPDSSHDVEDVEKYLIARESNQTRRKAGAHFLAAGRSMRVLKRIERSFRRCAQNWSAIFAVALTMRYALAELAIAVATKTSDGILLAANRHALGRGVNAVFASRSSILFFRSSKAGAVVSHNLDSPCGVPVALDSS